MDLDPVAITMFLALMVSLDLSLLGHFNSVVVHYGSNSQEGCNLSIGAFNGTLFFLKSMSMPRVNEDTASSFCCIILTKFNETSPSIPCDLNLFCAM